MKNIITIVQKELRRVFLDKKLIVSIVLLPGLMIFGTFILMGFMTDVDGEADDRVVDVHVSNFPGIKAFEDLLASLNIDAEELLEHGINVSISNFNFIEIERWNEQVAEEKSKAVIAEEIPLVIAFAPNFMEALEEVRSGSSDAIPSVTIFRNPSNSDSNFAFERFNNLFTQIRLEITNSLLDGPIMNIDDIQMADQNSVMGGIFASMFPMMIIISIVSAIISITPEMIAGEKERGSLPILLVTSIKRSHLAIAKVIGASLITMVSVISMLIGTLFGFQRFLNSVADGFVLENVYTMTDYLNLLLVFIVTTLVLTGIFSLISAFAKNTKEAMSYSSVLMMITMVIPIAATNMGLPDAFWMYLIPVVNTTLITTEIFTFQAAFVGVMLTIVSNLVFTLGLAYILTRTFESEKVMFSK